MPYCGLPAATRGQVEAGFRAGRSPDVVAVTEPGVSVRTGPAAWPSADDDGAAVGLALVGERVRPGRLPTGTTLDAVAPTLAAAVGLDRPFPEVRSGEALDVVEPGDVAPLIVVIVWKGAGSGEMTTLGDLGGAVTMDARAGSLPADAAAIVTTMGTGGVPSQHGITGTDLRADDGSVVPAFGPGAPLPVIASLAEDLDESTGQRSRIALVADASTDRGLIGGAWYPGADDDEVIVGSPRPAEEVAALLASGYGADTTPDMIGVTLAGPAAAMARDTRSIVTAVGPGAMVAVAGTGASAPARATPAAAVTRDLTASLGAPAGLIEAPAAGGLFLDADVASASELSTAEVADALAVQAGAGGGRRFADAAPGYSVTLAGYC